MKVIGLHICWVVAKSFGLGKVSKYKYKLPVCCAGNIKGLKRCNSAIFPLLCNDVNWNREHKHQQQ